MLPPRECRENLQTESRIGLADAGNGEALATKHARGRSVGEVVGYEPERIDHSLPNGAEPDIQDVPADELDEAEV